MTKYNESSIKWLKGLEAVRKRPTMYLGERGNSMAFQALKEIFDNAGDEFLAGRNKEIYVTIDNKQNTYMVADQSEGIPVGLIPVDPEKPSGKKISTLTLIFTEIHSGGKFDDSSYSVSKGTHGVGASCVNAISTSFEVWTNREGIWYYQKFAKGKPVTDVLKQKPPAKVQAQLPKVSKRGSIILWSLDHSIVSEDGKTKAVVNVGDFASWAKSWAHLNPGVKIVLSCNGKQAVYTNKVGLKALITQRLTKIGAAASGKPLIAEGPNFRLAIQWSNHPDAAGFETYVCSGRTIDGGKHEEGFRNALNASLSKYAKPNQKYGPRDVYSGLVGVFDFRISSAEYTNQTKEKLANREATKQVEVALKPVFEAFFSKNAKLARSIIKRACDIKKSGDAFRESLKAITNAKKTARGSLPTSLIAVPRCKPQDRELYIVEGSSAAGSAKAARNNRTQEVLKLDGKIINAARSPVHKTLKSARVVDMLTSIGFDFGGLATEGEEKKNKLRVGKVILLPDADEDGFHIRVLILTLLHTFMPELFAEGRVYVADAPLFSAFYRNTRYFGATFNEVRKQLPSAAPSKIISRAKGWGEISPEMLRYAAFDPATRVIRQVTPVVGRQLQSFDSLVGSETAYRKKLLGL